MKTFFAKTEDYNKNKQWQVVDAKGQIVGRLASKVAMILMGKDKADYTPHVETGEGVIVVNAAEIRISGKKAKTKLYKNYSGYPGGLRERTFERVMSEDPTYVITSAVRGMLPKNTLGRRMLTRLLVYKGAEHPHGAQKPKAVK